MQPLYHYTPLYTCVLSALHSWLCFNNTPTVPGVAGLVVGSLICWHRSGRKHVLKFPCKSCCSPFFCDFSALHQVRAVTVDKAEMKDAYQTPVYTTEARFREEVFTAQLKSKHTWCVHRTCS